MTSDGSAGGITPSQTVGPFFAYVLTPRSYGYPEIVTADLVAPGTDGERIRLEGYVVDGDGEPVADAMLELWQADGAGRHPEPAATADARPNARFTGFGRAELDTAGFYSFSTVRPGRVPGADGRLQAPHLTLAIFARGLLRQLFTRAYLEGEASNDGDPVLALVPPERRATLIASRRDRGGDIVYRFDIRLRGEGETVFFEA